MSDSNTLSVLQPFLVQILESFLNERVQAADAWIRRTDVSNNEELTSHLFGVSKTAALGDWVTGTESPVRPVGQGIAGRVMAAQSPLWVVDDSAEPSPSAEVVADVVDGSTRQIEGRSLGVKTMFGVPIFHRPDAKNPEAGRFEGALCFYSTEVIPESSEIARELLAAASAVAANFTFPNEGQIPTATRGDDGATTATPAPPGELSDLEEQAGADTAAPPLRPPMVFPFMDGGCGCGGRGVVGGAGTAAGLTAAAAAGALSSAGFPAGASPSFFQVMEQLQAAAQFQQQLQQQGGVGGGGGEARDGQQQGAADAAMAAAAASLGFSPEQLQLSQQALLEHQIQWQHEQQQQQQQQQQLLSMQIQSHLGIGQGMLSPSILQGLASGATSLPPGFPSALSSQLSSQLLQQGSPFLQAFSSQPLQPQQPLQPLPPSSSSSSSSSAQPGAGQQQLAEMANWADIAPAMAAGAFSQQALETIESALNQQTSAAAKASKRKSGSSSSSSSSSSDDAGGAASAGGNASSSSAKAAAWATGTAGGTGSNRVKGVGCAQEGCHKIAQGGTTMCIAHGGGRRCTHPGCSRGARDRFFCASHGGGKRCQSEGCGKSAVGATAFCTAHGGGKRCQSESCNKSAQSSTNFCVRHGGGRKCKSSGCEKVARGRTDHCAAHGGGTRCSASGCRKAALGGTALCRSHTQQEQQHAVAGVEGAALYAAAHAAAVVPAGTMTGPDPTAAAFAEYAMNNGVVAAAAAAAAAGSGGTGVGLEEIAASAVPRAIAAGVKRARDESSGDGVAEEDSEKEKGAKVSAVVASQCV